LNAPWSTRILTPKVPGRYRCGDESLGTRGRVFPLLLAQVKAQERLLTFSSAEAPLRIEVSYTQRVESIEASASPRPEGRPTIERGFQDVAVAPKAATALIRSTAWRLAAQPRQAVVLSSSFLGHKAHADMPEINRTHDVLVAPTTLPEGFPRDIVETALSGCLAMTTGGGGSLEFARRAELPLFPKEDAPALARLLERLALNPQERQEVARRAHGVSREHFTFEPMMERLLQSLESVAGSARRSTGHGPGLIPPGAPRCRGTCGQLGFEVAPTAAKGQCRRAATVR